MHQLVKLTDAIWLLQLAISSSLIHALGDPPGSNPFDPGSPDWEAIPGPQIERRMTYELSYPSP